MPKTLSKPAAAALFAASLFGLPEVATADETGPLSRVGSYPQFSGAIPFQINNNYTFDADGSSDYNNLSMDIEPAFSLSIIEPNPETLTLNVLFVIQQVEDPTPGQNEFFEDTGLFIQDLNIVYGDGRWEVMGGKFTPDFGTAWNLAPDLFGQDVPSDYEFDEQIGFGGSYVFGTGRWGFHQLTGSAFFQDNSPLSESLFTNRGRNTTSDGGPGNTGDPQSFAIAYDAEALPIFPDLGIVDTQLAFIRRARGEGDDSSEKGYAASASLSFPLSNDIESTLADGYSELNPFFEVAYFDDYDGVGGQDRYYLTAALDYVLGPWDFGTAYTLTITDAPGLSTEHDHIFSLQAGYTFLNGFQVEAGWNIQDTGGESSQTVGLQLLYEYDF